MSLPNFVASTTPSCWPFECLAEERLAAALVSVDVGGVEERHARSKCRVDDGARAFEIHAHAEVVATEADNEQNLGLFCSQATCTHGWG